MDSGRYFTDYFTTCIFLAIIVFIASYVFIGDANNSYESILVDTYNGNMNLTEKDVMYAKQMMQNSRFKKAILTATVAAPLMFGILFIMGKVGSQSSNMEGGSSKNENKSGEKLAINLPIGFKSPDSN